MQAITIAELRDALTQLGQMAFDQGKVIDLLIYGGSCLMLVSNFRISSADVDAVAIEDQSYVDQLAHEVARERGWTPDWLNDGVRVYLSPLVDGTEQHELAGAYPNDAVTGLRVFVPTPEYMLAMKLMALRVDPDTEGDRDLPDILNLMRVVGVKAKQDIVDFAARFYPEARVSGKLSLALDYIWKQYEAREAQPHVPPEYLGRTGQ